MYWQKEDYSIIICQNSYINRITETILNKERMKQTKDKLTNRTYEKILSKSYRTT